MHLASSNRIQYHPGGNPGANLKSISHRCYLREVAFEWELAEETIYLTLGCLLGGFIARKFLNINSFPTKAPGREAGCEPPVLHEGAPVVQVGHPPLVRRSRELELAHFSPCPPQPLFSFSIPHGAPHPRGNPGANVKPISHRCYLRDVALKGS